MNLFERLHFLHRAWRYRLRSEKLQEDRPDLLFECHHATNRDNDVFSFLKRVEYDGFCFYKDGFAPVSEYRSIRHLMDKKALIDFVFVPRERSGALTRRDATAAAWRFF